ncbi:hypothetical protein TNCV_4995791 [Trichonephila clavipes]|nr:hypothetical protein TNCV_4995791 [Trichonephila clavipes]
MAVVFTDCFHGRTYILKKRRRKHSNEIFILKIKNSVGLCERFEPPNPTLVYAPGYGFCLYGQYQFIHWVLGTGSQGQGPRRAGKYPDKLDLIRFSGNKFRSTSSKRPRGSVDLLRPGPEMSLNRLILQNIGRTCLQCRHRLSVNNRSTRADDTPAAQTSL